VEHPLTGSVQVDLAPGARSGDDVEGDGARGRLAECVFGHTGPGRERSARAISRTIRGNSRDSRLSECDAGGCQEEGDELHDCYESMEGRRVVLYLSCGTSRHHDRQAVSTFPPTQLPLAAVSNNVGITALVIDPNAGAALRLRCSLLQLH
jgi:hypothetical protein